MEFGVTKLGERGQIVIPQEFRKDMNLHKGEKFIVIKRTDTLLFKRMKPPSFKEFDTMLKKAEAHAKTHRLTEKDMWNAIKKVRARSKMEEYENSKDGLRYKIVSEEIEKLNKLIEGHKKLLTAIGNL